ncbi:hypothetical protein Tsubulata_017901 [Turnera subulata]|uniref:Uncharacterized protein n=1 Tax=Turnera subulata TaxID=218843 RepID=A0A9Q0F270_9ROSI|nr:hypothetical protein Tsubulata_017901 [Turnera subulata]
MDVRHPRKLDFNLPLLSTRRLCSNSEEEASRATNSHAAASRDTSNRIPFCWEQAPGKPKFTNDISNEDVTPRPRPPPCRWHPQMEEAAARNEVENPALEVDHDDGCDADVDDDNEDDKDEAFSDAVEVLSLTEAIDIAQKADEEDHGILDRLTLDSVNSTDSQSPNYMIERFLPDATALAAASSAFFAMNNLNRKLPYMSYYQGECSSGSAVGGPCSASESSHTGCGLEHLFSWRMKHKLCGVKSPVRHVSPNVIKPHQRTAKLNKRHSSSWPFADVLHKDK